MNIFRFQNFFAFVSLCAVLLSVASIVVFGLRLGIDFTGGSLLEIQYQNTRPSVQDVSSTLSQFQGMSFAVQPIGETGMVIRTQDLPEETHQQILNALGQEATETRFESIGPVIGKELRGQAFIFITLSLLLIIGYIALAFRKTTEFVMPWQWSLSALFSLLHNLMISLGALALLGKFQGVEITIPIVVALLTVVGYSINDTIVVFDRIRENIVKRTGVDFTDTVQKSIRQTLGRSFNTSFTTLLVLFAIVFFGGATLTYFALTLIVGIVAGTYSSLFFAPWVLKMWQRI